MSGGRYDYLCWAFEHEGLEGLLAKRHHLEEMSKRLAALGYADDAARETEELLVLLRQFANRAEVRTRRLADVWHAVEWWDSGDSGEDVVREELAKYRGDQPGEPTRARRWRINPDTLQVEPEDGQPVGTFTEHDLAQQQWPPCPACGATIVQDFVDIHSSDDPGPVYVPGSWRCPNDCDPRPAQRGTTEGRNG